MTKKNLNKQDYIFQDQTDQILIKTPGKINGIDFYISNLINCEVYLCDHIAQVNIIKIYELFLDFNR